MKDDYQIIPFDAAHAHIIFSGDMNDERMEFGRGYQEHFKKLEQPGLAWSLTKNDKVIASGGFSLMWDQVYEGWVLCGAEVNKNKLSFARNVKRILDTYMRVYSIQRVQTAVDIKYEKGVNFAKFLGFEYEGLMKNYIRNTSHFLYARTA